MAAEAKFATSGQARQSGWYSRRHKMAETHEENLARNSQKARQAARQESAAERLAARAKRTPQQQLAFLNERLGVDMGARHERERLESRGQQ